MVALMAARICGEDCRLQLLLMSCRVLGRRLEEEMFNLLGTAARDAGAEWIIGVYRPTAKNGMTRSLLGSWGFTPGGEDADGSVTWTMSTSEFVPRSTEIDLEFAGAPVGA